MVGTARVRLVEVEGTFTGLVFLENLERARLTGTDADYLWQKLLTEVAKLSPSFFGYDGARARFFRMMPRGFAEPSYVANERTWKLRAQAKLNAALPLEAAITWSGDGEGALAAFRATNQLFSVESARVQEVLRSPVAAAFIRGAAAFAVGDLETGLRDMAHVLKPSGIAKWTAVTYLPSLWRPEAHMFLKPEVTRDFAARVGHPFVDAYSPELKPAVYQHLLDLVETTEREIADLHPADKLDVQGFIWVVGKYVDEGKSSADKQP